MVRLFTSHWRNPDLADVDATIVSIIRGQPRWPLPFRYRKLSDLAPGNEAWAQEDREAFEAAYLAQLEELGPEHILERLEALSGGKEVVLLCWEKLADPDEWCHRSLLASYIKETTGLEVPELAPGDLPQRPDSPQMRLFG